MERPVAQDRRAVHDAAVGQVVVHRIVLRDAVVPERDGVRLPVPAHLELRLLDMHEQHVEQRVALVAAQALDAVGEAVIDEQPVRAGFRMGAHHRMDDRRMFVQRLGGLSAPACFATCAALRKAASEIVHRIELGEEPLQRLRQRLHTPPACSPSRCRRLRPAAAWHRESRPAAASR